MLAAVRFAPLLKCMWFLELQIICAVHLAKPFGHYSLPRLRAIRRGTSRAVTSRGAHWQWGADSLALSQLSGPPPWAEAHPAIQPSHWRLPALSLVALGWSPVLRCELGILKGMLYRRVLSRSLLTFWEARRNI